MGTVNPSGANVPVAAGDLLIIIQVQDDSIVSANDNTYGDGVVGLPASGSTKTGRAGRFEYTVVTSVSGTTVTLNAPLKNFYVKAAATPTHGRKCYQVIRVPQYANLSFQNNTIIDVTPWDGNSGGVFAVDVSNALTWNGATINAPGRGFRGGGRRLLGSTGLSSTDVRAGATSNANGAKGEGLADTPRYVFNALTSALVSNADEG